jgi:FAD/FMN-containing dehydrogenase/Fe-S oxidoreductase
MNSPPDNAELMAAAAPELARALGKDVRWDPLTRALYATDASNYRIPPLAVVTPRDRDQVSAAVAVAAKHDLPILARGAGTSMAGNAVGAAIILDFTRHLDRILDLDPASRLVRVEPGVVAGRLNRSLAAHRLHFGPDPATLDRCTLGGMIGNNSCGAHSLAYGKTVHHLERMTVLLADGTRLEVDRDGPCGTEAASERVQSLARTLRAIGKAAAGEVRARYPRIPRRVSGYNLDEILPERSLNLAGLLCGSEGTLGVTLEATVRLVERPRAKALALLAFTDVPEALDAVPELTARHQPSAIELVDRTLVTRAAAVPRFHATRRLFDGGAGATLLVEVSGEAESDVRERIAAVGRERLPGLASARVIVEPAMQEEAWALRESALGLLWQGRGAAKPIAGVEDTAVAPQRLGEYVRSFRELLRAHGTAGSFYGHAGEGCLHIRVLIDLGATGGPAALRRLTEEVAELVLAYGGALSGEHGDGLARSELLGKMYGPAIVDAYRQVKAAFDPRGLLNPGKIVDPAPLDRSLRLAPGQTLREPVTFFDWSARDGIGRAVEACIGLGKCTKLDQGTMCPSYMVTRDERDSTRGRANALREAMRGELLGGGPLGSGSDAGFSDPRLAAALDLCLACKACKRECPTGVDMARMKAEFLALRRATGRRSWRDEAFAAFRAFSVSAALAPALANGVAGSRLGGALVRRLAGIHPRRSLPRFARRSFRAEFGRRSRGVPAAPKGARVVLLDDTFNNYQEPQILAAAATVLGRAGFAVELPARPICCGRPLISLGFLAEARSLGRELLAVLAAALDQGAFVTGCEPSCLLTFRDELPDLVPGPRARLLASRTRLLAELLVEQAAAPGALSGRAIVHGHCHERALTGMAATTTLLAGIQGLEWELLDSGCCGMAGGFGYTREHYPLSMANGERVLLPRARAAAADTILVADGTSCRHQIRDGAGRRAIHLAELLLPAGEPAASGGA